MEFKATMRAPTKLPESILSKQKAQEKVTDQERTTLEQAIIKEKKILVQALEHEIYKTIAALMNSYGGQLLVGIGDNREISGIEEDFETFKDRRNLDGWLQHFANLIDDHIGKEFMRYIRPKAVIIDGKTVVMIHLERSSKPVYVEFDDIKGQKKEKKMEFYIRGFNTTQTLNPKEAHDYINDHWKNN